MYLGRLRRRDFFSLPLVVAGLSSAAAFAQSRKIARVGVLVASTENDPEVAMRLASLKRGLEDLGWKEGLNIRTEYRWSGDDPSLTRAYAADLVDQNLNVIFAAATSTAVALQRETRSVPIVFTQVADPVGAGLVSSLAQPGGNITGFSHFEFPFAAKWLELLKQIAPEVIRVAALYDPANPASTGYLPILEVAARTLSVEIYPTAVRSAGDIASTVGEFSRKPNSGLILIPGPIMSTQRSSIISLTSLHRLPSVYGFRYYPAGGGLASYGIDLIDLYRRGASYLDRILRGEKPSELPVQTPTKFELVINLKTAEAIGLQVPPTLLARADEVIE